MNPYGSEVLVRQPCPMMPGTRGFIRRRTGRGGTRRARTKGVLGFGLALAFFAPAPVCLVASARPTGLAIPQDGGLRAGFSRVDITPPPGLGLQGLCTRSSLIASYVVNRDPGRFSRRVSILVIPPRGARLHAREPNWTERD
jgi:hypothetical protein